MTWWLKDWWTKTTCSRCGRNIWESGGDPDWGLCSDCFQDYLDEKYGNGSGDFVIKCEICGIDEAVASRYGYAVCSPACEARARKRREREEKEKENSKE